jgi:Protein of unknown function (DUF3352)
MRIRPLLLICFVALLLAGCGSGSGGDAGADPATAVPADAPIYVEVVARPEGDLREDALAAAGKVLRTDDPSRTLTELLDRALGFDFERDVEPWLGERVGFWMAAGVETAAMVIATTDADQAMESLEASVTRDGTKVTERSHGDAEYFVDPDGYAAGVAGDFALLGPERELKRMVDALAGDSLADSDRYRAASADLEDSRLAHFFLEPRAIFQLAEREDPESAQALRRLESFIPFDRLPAVTGAFMANGDRIALDAGARLPEDQAVRDLGVFVGGRTDLIRELPGDSWAAFGSPRLGETWRTALDRFGGALGAALLEEQLRSATGLELERDLLDWIGDVAFFARGTTPSEIDGGLVIAVTDEDRAAAAFGKIVGALRTRARIPTRPLRIEGAETAFAIQNPELPRPIVLARSSDKVVAAYGPDAAVEALDPSEPLGDSDTYGLAQDVLGDGIEPAMLLSLPAVISLVEASDDAGAEFQRARPYLEAFTTIAIGGAVEDERARFRIAAGLE